MNLIFITTVLALGVMFIGSAALAVYRSWPHAGRKKWLTVIGGGLAVVGGLGFFIAALSASGGLRWLPASVEWPVGFTNRVLIMPDGKHVVPHTAVGRIQVYDPEWRYLTGWFVDAGGGTFKIRLYGRDDIEVITARLHMRYLYTVDGSLLWSQTYLPLTYSDYPSSRKFAVVPTHWWLWPFAGLFFSWIIGALGMAVMMFSDPPKMQQRWVRL